MTTSKAHLIGRRLRTPRAAAVAGILFAVLIGTSVALLRSAAPADVLDTNDWLAGRARAIALGLGLMPFAGISFLWFMGVVRDRMGYLEDQFFSTLFFGSGFMYLAMTFSFAALAGGVLFLYTRDPGLLIDSKVFAYSRAVMYQISNVYSMRMAGMHMLVLGTIWVRTRVIPRWLAFVTFALALVLLVTIGFTQWVTLVFPSWVAAISIYILVMNYRRKRRDVPGEHVGG